MYYLFKNEAMYLFILVILFVAPCFVSFKPCDPFICHITIINAITQIKR